jgi:hypothetical protein
MYGTVARVRLKPGREAEFLEIARTGARSANGLVFDYVYRLDADPCEYLLVVGFADKRAYVANAAAPEQHAQYLRYRALTEHDPEWLDGEIVFAMPR